MSLPPLTCLAMTSDALPVTGPPLAWMRAARVASLEVGAAGRATDPPDDGAGRVVVAGGGADVDASTTAAAAATAAIPAPMPTLPRAPSVPRPRPRAREKPHPGSGTAGVAGSCPAAGAARRPP